MKQFSTVVLESKQNVAKAASNESKSDKFVSGKQMENSDEETASEKMKKEISETLSAWNKRHVLSALFSTISDSQRNYFIRITKNCTIYPVRKDEEGGERQIVNGKVYVFIHIPEKLTAASAVAVFNAVSSYNRDENFQISHAKENEEKERKAKINALQTVISITNDETVKALLQQQLESLMK